MRINVMKHLAGALLFVLLCSPAFLAQSSKYPTLVDDRGVIQGDAGKWDENKVHTLSIVEANKDGYKYWGYYGLAYYGDSPVSVRKAGIVRSNDLVTWEKYEGNPIIEGDCRWPTVVIHDGVFYMFYAEYKSDTDSRIVMVSSKDGIKFENKTEVVPMEWGKQNQNPFIFYDKKDKNFYLTYYTGDEKNKDTTKKNWNIAIRKSKTIEGLKTAKTKILLSSPTCLAAPSIAYYNNKYYLLVEAFIYGKWNDQWVTLGYECDKPDGNYKEVNNEPPVLSNNDACAFQYVFDNELYITYSHCLNLTKWEWELRMVKAKK